MGGRTRSMRVRFGALLSSLVVLSAGYGRDRAPVDGSPEPDSGGMLEADAGLPEGDGGAPPGPDAGPDTPDAGPPPRWVIERVSELGYSPSLALDAEAEPHVLFQSIDQIGWSRRGASGWSA